MTAQSVLHEISRLKDESCAIVDVTQCPSSICEGCPIPMLADVAVRLLTERDAAIADNHRLTERNTALEAVADALRDTPPYTQEYAGGGYNCKICGCNDTRPSSYWAKAHAEWVPHESDCPFAALAELDALCAAPASPKEDE